MARYPRICLVFLESLLITVSFLGCSVKEDRDRCPCHLELYFPEPPGEPVAIYAFAEGFSRSDTIPAGLAGYIVEVPRRDVSVNLYSPPVLSSYEGMTIPYGQDCPPVMMASRKYDASCEFIRDTVRLRKNYCRLSLRLVLSDPSEPYPFSLTVRGEVCGYGRNALPLAGPFGFRMKPGEDKVCTVGLPRQRDDSLLLDIVSADGTLRTFALGEIMAASGYDWSLPDLEDCELVVDYSRTSVTFRTDYWSRTFSFEYFL